MDKVSQAVTVFWLMVCFACYISFKNLEVSNHEYFNTCRLIEKSQDSIKNMMETESHHRNYLILGEPEYLNRYEQAKAKILPSLAEVEKLAVTKTQIDKLQNAEQIIKQSLVMLDTSLATYKQKGFAATQQELVAQYKAVGLTPKIEFKNLMEEVIIEEQRMLEVRESMNKHRFHSVEICIYGAIVVSAIFFLLPMLVKLKGLYYGSN